MDNKELNDLLPEEGLPDAVALPVAIQVEQPVDNLARHPLVFRILHWLDVPTMSIMLWSGLLIYWAYDKYSITIFGYTLFKFFPNSWYKALGVDHELSVGLAWHFAFMWLFTLIGVGYSIFLLASGYWRRVVPTLHDFLTAPKATLQDLGILKGHPEETPYNSPQKIAYFGTLVAGWVMGLSGWAIYKPIQLWWLCAAMGGYEWARAWHFCGAIYLVLFILVHVLQVIRAGWRSFLGMVTGE